jgi:2-oxoglutarate ferredoxin oxidoreductase subunit delta
VEIATTTPYAAERRPHRPPTIVDYVNIRWVDEWCKRCNICVEICPKASLVLTHDAIIEATDCIRCGLCERYCPDLAIEVLPKRDENGKLPPANQAEEAASARNATPPHIPDVARGPAVAGTDPHRGITDTESAPKVDRDNPT